METNHITHVTLYMNDRQPLNKIVSFMFFIAHLALSNILEKAYCIYASE